MARNSDYEEHIGSTEGSYALMAIDLGGGAYRLRWVRSETLGSQGPLGVPGLDGESSSSPGPVGDKGPTGVTGPQGPAGMQGNLGEDAENAQPNIFLDDGFAQDIFEDYSEGQASGFNAGRGWSGDWQSSNAQIVSRTSYNGQIQKRLSLSNGEIGRTFRFGSSWNKIQISILARINSAVALPAMNYYFGVCSGKTDMASSASTSNFIGLAGSAASTITWSTLSFAQQDSLLASGNQAISRRGNTNTVIGSPSGMVLPSTEAALGQIWMEITRAPFASDASSVTYTQRIMGVSGVSTRAGMSLLKEGFVNSLHKGPSTTEGLLGSVDSTFTPMFDQSTGPLDTFNFFWDSPAPIEIAAVGIRKIF